MGTYVHEPERVHLCRSETEYGWSASGDLTQDGVHYVFRVSDDGSESRMRGPLPKVYWVNLNAFSAGRSAGERAPPMVYDPSEAVLTLDGRPVTALPRLWTAELVQGRFEPVRELPVPSDLNAPALRGSHGFFIAFPSRPPGARTPYTLSPGSILLDGRRVSLPLQRACQEEARTRYSPLR